MAVARRVGSLIMEDHTAVTEARQEPPHGLALTPREWEVAREVADGLSYSEIATRLGISKHTVDAHLRSIFRKVNVRSARRLAALMHAGKITAAGIDSEGTCKDPRFDPHN